jgi:hypothetical protein
MGTDSSRLVLRRDIRSRLRNRDVLYDFCCLLVRKTIPRHGQILVLSKLTGGPALGLV